MVRRAVAAIVLLAASPCFAYVRTTNGKGTPIRWPSNEVTIEGPADAPAGVTHAQVMAALVRAGEAWSAPACTSMKVTAVPHAGAAAQVAADKHTQLIVRTQKCEGANCVAPLQLAVTTVFARADTGEIIDADIELNALTFEWTDIPDSGANPKPGAADLANVLTHELGHLLGLSENCSQGEPTPPRDETGNLAPACTAAPAALREATMFPAVIADDIERRTLAADDIAGICAIYPRNGSAADASAPDAGIAIGVDDGGSSLDGADAPPPAAAGTNCGCHAGGAGVSTIAWGALALLGFRRRRRGRVAH